MFQFIHYLPFLKEVSIHWKYAQDSILAKLIQFPRLGLVTDVDGTISPIVAHPEEAKISTNIKNLLSGLSTNLFLVGVISGRAVEDIVHRVGVSDLIYIGNHGFERWTNGESVIHPQAAQFRLALEAAMEDIRLLLELRAGMYIEDKGATISIHYRQSQSQKFVNDKDKPKIQAIAKRHQLVFSEGRMVYELRPPIKINKGTAFEKIVEEHKLDAALYIGDDI
ncbi:MAG: trehalose-phosphatase, partial [Anaerolineales bacterium]|nr:trehalose-phosphatase [Anaerolineales bacterium]